ncbi:MAG TPA: hypothetical protein VJY39_08860 [Acidisphaera sp.]|nr:hypothetical protein [Acidisphaera sp.]
MTLRLAVLACLLGIFVGAGIGVAQEVLFPSSPARSADRSPARTQTAANDRAAGEVAVRVYPPRSGVPRFVGLLDAIDRDHKGYVTIDDIKAFYEARVFAKRADAAPMAAR